MWLKKNKDFPQYLIPYLVVTHTFACTLWVCVELIESPQAGMPALQQEDEKSVFICGEKRVRALSAFRRLALSRGQMLNERINENMSSFNELL
jgi:hypothetical protein